MHKSTSLLSELKKNKIMFLMLSPAVIYFFIFNYLPMSGIIVAFKYFRYDKGILHSPWIGFKNFDFFFQSGQAWLLTKNTILYNLVFIASGVIFAIVIAIIFSELKGKYFKKITHAAMFLPFFISWVVVGAFVYSMLNYEFGSVNTLLKALHFQPVDVYGTPSAWKYIIVGFYLWKSVGYGSIIYLAVITGINPELYEAADLDGASVYQKIYYITLPLLKVTIMMMVLLQIGQVLRGNFDMFYQLVGNNGTLFNATDVIDTYVFRALISANDMGLSAAIGLYQNVIGFVVVLTFNYLANKVNKDYALF
ncbi:sugar ABC transporter permease [Paenibacillus baekrokdamisoli]|uniref:Sugar ABC transporter permease n=1 Tax=Paenibacillus baekrokdamisoli TaxID=1712516 RepID=A0A3G9J537_9BACL|nr:ABC transporter permease subunit [Paenibacillus baekrokdamisoli]MBB3069218.1 putative aldouronate transport system permease protein [Paenibacillus baekrokdamisoli]BBH18808.1 sugar ABC transporter permease [Paenibacillus baekrokdamisoli]